MVSVKIPYEFIKERVTVNWKEILFALENHLIAPRVAIEHATQCLTMPRPHAREEVELAGLSPAEPMLSLVARLAGLDSSPSPDQVRSKWLYLALAWLFENRASLADPLQVVEHIYSEFGYPDEMSGFVRYLPMVGPDLGSYEKNVLRLYDNWKTYLNETGARFAPSK